MALTYRSEKGSALTNTELDDNFRHFTGSHSITGSLTVSGSVIPADVSGTLGTADNPWKSLYVDQGTIYFISGSNSGSMSWNSGSGFSFGSSSLSSLDVNGNSTFTGSVTISGSNTFVNIGPAEFSGSVKVYSGSVSIGHTDSYKIVSTLNNIYSGSLNWTENNAFSLLSNQNYYNRLHISNSAGPQLVIGDEYSSINIGSGSGGANIGNTGRVGNSVAIGTEALANLTISNGQVAIGHKAGYSDRSSYGVYVGVNAGAGMVAQNANTAIGAFALSASLPNDQLGNTAVGYLAGVYNSGSSNTYIGSEAGGVYIAGGTHYPSSSNSIFIGYRAGWNPNTGSDGNNMIVINAKPDSNNYGGGKGSNTAVLGNSDITHTYLYGTITEPSGLHVATSSAYNTDINFKNLPTSSTGLDTGSLWLSGSDGAGSQFLMVYNP
jgi:hypothetical protein